MTDSYANGFVDGGELALLKRKADGSLVKVSKKAEYIAFIKEADLTPAFARELRSADAIAGFSKQGDYVRIQFKDGDVRRSLVQDHSPRSCRRPNCDHRNYFARHSVKVYEGDVHPMRRFFSDSGAEIAKPNRVYLDIETDSRKTFAQARAGETRVLSWVLVDEDAQLVAAQVLEEYTDESERKLLEALWVALDPFDQIVAWNGDGFDFPVIKLRSDSDKGVSAEHKDYRRWLYLDHMEAFEKLNTAAESGDEKQSLRLDDVCMQLIGEGKDDFDSSKTYEAWAAGGAERERMLRYNIKDTMLLAKLEKKTGYLGLFQKICELCRLFPETRSLHSTMQVDGYMLRRGVECGQHFTTKLYEPAEKLNKFKGAYVLKPKVSGIAKNIHVVDFAGMYPSVIMTWNMSPETVSAIPTKGPIPPGHCRAINGVEFATEAPGILSGALLDLKKMREFWKKKKAQTVPGSVENIEADRLQTTYKVIANSFYGVVGSKYSRFFHKDMAEAITQTCAWFIQQVEQLSNQRGWPVVYSDTDSIYAQDATVEGFTEFAKWCNSELFPKLVAERGCSTNYVELEYEKAFERIVFVSAKKYAAYYLHYKHKKPDANSKPEIKGLEYMRGDSSAMARRFQKRVIDMLMKEKVEDPESFVPVVLEQQREVFEKVLAINEVKIAKAINRSLETYAQKVRKDGALSSQPAHVRLAKVLKERGDDVREGTKIEYYVVDGAAKPIKCELVENYKGDADRHYVWEELVYKPTYRLLKAAFPDYDWDQYAKTRPKLAKGRKRVPEEQGSLFVSSPMKLPPPPPPLAALGSYAKTK